MILDKKELLNVIKEFDAKGPDYIIGIENKRITRIKYSKGVEIKANDLFMYEDYVKDTESLDINFILRYKICRICDHRDGMKLECINLGNVVLFDEFAILNKMLIRVNTKVDNLEFREYKGIKVKDIVESNNKVIGKEIIFDCFTQDIKFYIRDIIL